MRVTESECPHHKLPSNYGYDHISFLDELIILSLAYFSLSFRRICRFVTFKSWVLNKFHFSVSHLLLIFYDFFNCLKIHISLNSVSD